MTDSRLPIQNVATRKSSEATCYTSIVFFSAKTWTSVLAAPFAKDAIHRLFHSRCHCSRGFQDPGIPLP